MIPVLLAAALWSAEAPPSVEDDRPPVPVLVGRWLTPTAVDGGRLSIVESGCRLGGPPWWRSADGRSGSVLGLGYQRSDVLAPDLGLPTVLQSTSLNSVSWWRSDDGSSVTLLLTPSSRTAAGEMTWGTTRFNGGVLGGWSLGPTLRLSAGVMMTADHRRVLPLPAIGLVWRPDPTVRVDFQGVSTQATWTFAPEWMLAGGYGMGGGDYHLAADDPDGEDIRMRDVRVHLGLRRAIGNHLSVQVDGGAATFRRISWEGDDTRDAIRPGACGIIGAGLFVRW